MRGHERDELARFSIIIRTTPNDDEAGDEPPRVNDVCDRTRGEVALATRKTVSIDAKDCGGMNRRHELRAHGYGIQSVSGRGIGDEHE